MTDEEKLGFVNDELNVVFMGMGRKIKKLAIICANIALKLKAKFKRILRYHQKTNTYLIHKKSGSPFTFVHKIVEFIAILKQ
jgi:hypothetical protein